MLDGWAAIEPREHFISLRGMYVGALIVYPKDSLRSRTVRRNSHKRILRAVFGGVIEDLDERQGEQLRITSNLGDLRRYEDIDMPGVKLERALSQDSLN